MIARAALALVLMAVAAPPARAEVVSREADGFVASGNALVPKPPAAVWAALLQWGAWWSPEHSYSGQAANFALAPNADGALVERWDGGSVRHAVVLAAFPGKLLRLQGGFGPLQALPVSAVLEFRLVPEGAGTRLSFTYRVAGPGFAGLADLAGPVDAVMTEALGRLARFAATGQP